MNDPDRFDPATVGVFRVVDRSFESGSRTVTLGYALDDEHEFVETITFETPTPTPITALAPGMERALLHLHVAAGTSYYKTAAPRIVSIEGASLSTTELDFHHHLYDEGLREFAVTNGLEVPRPVVIRSDGGRGVRGPGGSSGGSDRPARIAVPIGGGKDSMVLIEALKPLDPLLFAVNPHPRVIALAEKAGLELLVVRRDLSPHLDELNRSGALNGHVPITAIISLIAVVGSFLYGYDTIAMAVERSASEETVHVDGVPVNHQYSKSLVCELAIRGLVSGCIDPDLVYGSALRPYSELAIARAFAALREYHADFCSCNRIFRRDGDGDGTDSWCGECPKCRFVALMLAPFLDPGALSAIIGRDLFADPAQLPGFAALMSDEEKPFECVGERRESAAALRMLADLPGWQNSPVVAGLADEARRMLSDPEVRALLAPQPELAFPDPLVASYVQAMMDTTT